jgi:hypothetical protein
MCARDIWGGAEWGETFAKEREIKRQIRGDKEI